MPNGRAQQRGFSFIFVLLLLALLGLGLAAAGSLWQTDARRAREVELLFVGSQYRDAIRKYYELDANQPRLPQSLDDLLLDDRRPTPLRHLRRAYPDPVTNEPFELVRSPDGGGIVGVRSRSQAAPLKLAGFAPENAAFSEAQTYADWTFVFTPRAAAPARTGAPTAPGSPAGSPPNGSPPAPPSGTPFDAAD